VPVSRRDPIAGGAPDAAPAMPESAAVRFGRPILREQVKDLLLQRIVSGEYPPGSRLVETHIAGELGISQAPVREALRDLEQLGCVVHEPFRGTSVRRFSVPELLDAFPVRSALEELAARLAVELISEDQLEGLAARIDGMREAAARGDVHDESLEDVAFHAAVIEAAGNTVLERQWLQLQPYARTFVTVALPHQDLGAVSERHVPILEALRRRDADEAAAAIRLHLEQAADLLRPLAAMTPGDKPPRRPRRDLGEITGEG
jgi:DNA-binding GntR family transcriptional regulator